MMYHTCPYCGANLDPGERCDCQKEESAPAAGTAKSANSQEPKPQQISIYSSALGGVLQCQERILHENRKIQDSRQC